MIKLSLQQANQPETQVQVDANVATIGRAQGVEVLIQQPYVSKRHVRLLRGLVLVDLGSSNGTFVGGKRISEPTLLTGNEFQLGEGDITVRVLDMDADQGSSTLAAAGGDAGAELEALRDRLAERDEELKAAHAIVDRLHSKTEGLRSEIQRLRVNTPPPSEADPGSADSSAAANAALERLGAELAQVSQERDQLARELEQARGEVDRLTASATRLEAAQQALQEETERLSARLVPTTSPEALEELREENQRLRSELEQAAQRPAVPTGPMGDLLIRLQAENSALKRQSSAANLPPAAESDGAHPAARPSEPPSKLLAELLELRQQYAALKAQQGVRPAPVPAMHVAPHGGSARALVRLADDDIERCPPDLDAEPEEFVSAELFRVTRQFERVITRIAGDHIQLFQSNTMLPNVEGNLRGLVGTIVGDASERDARQELIRYFDQMSKWLVASHAANRKATKLFAEKLRTDLSESGLLAQGPIPAFRRLSGGADAELWKRTCAYMRELTPDILDDTIERFARDAVRELLGSNTET